MSIRPSESPSSLDRLFGDRGSGGGPGPLPPLSSLVCPPHPNRFWFFKFLILVGITVGAFYIPDGSFTNGRWPWWDGWGLPGRRWGLQREEHWWGLLFALAHRPQAADWVNPLPSWPGDSALVLGHMAFGQYGGGVGGRWVEPASPLPHTPPHCLSVPG